MTVLTTTAKAGPYAGAGATGPFTVPFRFLEASHLRVVREQDGIETVLVLGTDYTVSGVGASAGAVTLAVALPVGQTLTVVRNVPATQEADYVVGDAFPAESHEEALDKLTMLTQQLQEEVSRSAKLPVSNAADADSLVADIVRLADSAANIDTVAGSVGNVNAVSDDIANVNTVAGIAGNVTTVAGISSAVSTVAGIDDEVVAVAGNATNINAVAGNATNINAVNANKTNIDAVAGNATNINTVAGNNANVTAVGSSIGSVNAVAGIHPKVTTVANSISDVNSCAANMAAILDAPNQASAAAASAAAAAASLDNFDDRYLGSKTSNPTVDNDGNPLVVGALYYRSTAPIGMKVYDGAQWIEATASQQASLVTFEFVATAGQTTFSGNDANGVPLSYIAGGVIVSLNGVILRPGDDYTATSGVSVVLASGASVGDELCVHAFSSFAVANTYTQAEADGRFVNVTGDTMTGPLVVDGSVRVWRGASGNSFNSAFGDQSLIAITTGQFCTALGRFSLSSLTNSSNCTGVGNNAQVTGSNQVQLGDSFTTTYVYGTVQNRSDLRDKADVRDTTLGLDFINALRPVDYKWDMREDYRPPMPDPLPEGATDEQKAAHALATQDWIAACKHDHITRDGSKKRHRYHHGLIAQEVKAVLDAQGIDFGGYQDHKVQGGEDVLSIGYDELIAPLVKAVQQLSARVEQLEAQIN